MTRSLRFAVATVVFCCAAACGGEPPNTPAVPSVTTAKPPDATTTPDASAGEAATTKTLYIREMRADCEGEGPRKCLQVRESENGEWTLFYAPIKGFKYEEGTKYAIKVSVEKVLKPMADASSLSYTLVEIVSQQKVK
jgi:hypothetical protein